MPRLGKMNPNYDDRDRQRVIELSEQGLSSTIISLRTGVSQASVSRWIKQEKEKLNDT